MIRKFLISTIVILGLSVQVWAQGASLNARISNDRIGANEYLQVAFVVGNMTEEVNFEAPAFRQFQVVQGPMMGQSSNISITNGKRTVTHSITYTYVLKPKSTGTLTVEPASITVNGRKVATGPIRVEVLKDNPNANAQRGRPAYEDPFDEMDRMMEEMMRRQQQAMQRMMQQMEDPQPRTAQGNPEEFQEKDLAKNLFIKAEVDNTNPYIGQQVNVTYKLYTRLQMSMQMTAMPSLKNFWSKEIPLPPDQQPTRETIDGRQYEVFTLKKTALFPNASGNLVLDPAKAQGKVVVAEKVGDTPYGTQWGGKELDLTISSKPVNINVKPLPETNRPEIFTGGVGNLSIQSKIDTGKFSTDDVIRLYVRVNGTGNINLIGAPILNLPNGLSTFEPEVMDSVTQTMPKILGYKTFTYTITPDRAGKYTIPAIEFSYFDIDKKQYVTLKTEDYQLDIAQGTKQTIATSNQDKEIHQLNPLMKDLGTGDYKVGFVEHWSYKFLLILTALATGLGVGILARNKSIQANLTDYKTRKANKVAWKRLSIARKAMKKNNPAVFYEEISKAIWLYLSDKLAIPLSELSKETVADKLSLKGVDQDYINRTHQLITQTEMALYSGINPQQQMNAVLDQASQLISDFEKVLK